LFAQLCVFRSNTLLPSAANSEILESLSLRGHRSFKALFCYFHQRWRETHSRRFMAGPPGRRRRPWPRMPLDQFARDLALQCFRRMASFSG
jgi:hypothetical protein